MWMWCRRIDRHGVSRWIVEQSDRRTLVQPHHRSTIVPRFRRDTNQCRWHLYDNPFDQSRWVNHLRVNGGEIFDHWSIHRVFQIAKRRGTTKTAEFSHGIVSWKREKIERKEKERWHELGKPWSRPRLMLIADKSKRFVSTEREGHRVDTKEFSSCLEDLSSFFQRDDCAKYRWTLNWIWKLEWWEDRSEDYPIHPFLGCTLRSDWTWGGPRRALLTFCIDHRNDADDYWPRCGQSEMRPLQIHWRSSHRPVHRSNRFECSSISIDLTEELYW